MKKTNIAIILIIILSFVVGIYALQNIQADRIATHWNANGEVNGYMSKFWGVILFPLITIGIYLLFLLIPKIDPLKQNIQKFRKHYDLFILIMIIFLSYTYVLTILTNLGHSFNMTTMIMPAIGLLFIFIGIIMNKLKMNWFIGIRTPWTLSNNTVWQKTHKLGSTLFKTLGAIMILAIFAPPKYLVWIILIPTLIIVIWLFAYSYFEFKRIKKE